MRPWLFLAPSLAGTAIFVLIPFVNVVARSFFQAVGGQFVGMENFMQVFHSQAFRLAVKNTLHFILVCIPVLMAFSLWTAVLVTAAADSRNLYKATLLLPMAIPVASVVLLWKLLLYPQGLLDQLAGTGLAESGKCLLYPGADLYMEKHRLRHDALAGRTGRNTKRAFRGSKGGRSRFLAELFPCGSAGA